MYPLNDKDLDRLSRDAAEHYDVQSSTSGWERLESRLDKELPVKEKDRKRFLFWLFFIALLSGGALVYMLGRSPAETNLASDKEEAGVVGKVPAAEVRKADAAAEKKASETTGTPDQEKNVQPEKNQAADKPVPAAAVKDGKNEPANSSVVKTDAATKTADKNLNPNSKDKTNLQKNISRSKDQSSLVRNVRNNKPVKNKTGKQPAASDADQLLAKNNNNDQSMAGLMKTTMPVIDAQKMYDLGKINKDIPAPPAVQETAKKPEVKQKQSKWEFGLLTGPDFNNVKFKHNYKTGLNLGLTVGYRISDRWQVNTGLLYTKKWYKVAGEDFTPPKHSYLSYQDVKMVEGSCNMFEIPINVRYDFAYNKQSRWFASTGISNYIMDKQEYNCDYVTSGGAWDKFYWKEDSNYNYTLSNLNLSIGYERAIGKNFSIQAEPYFKVPLKGLGYGSIKMNSYGMYVTFKYRPSARVKK